MKKISIFLMLILVTAIQAQQDPQITQFMYTKLIYNPGYAGTSNALCANALFRKQWTSFPGAPTTMILSADMPVMDLPIGAGLNIMNDQIGAIKTLYARLALAYNKQIGPGKLGVGIDAGILQNQVSEAWIVPEPGKVDNSIPGNYTSGTQSISNPDLNKLSYDLSFGIYYGIPNKMYVGIASTHLPAQELKAGNAKYILARHYYIMAGYTFELNPFNSITPNVNVKSDGSTSIIDINLTYTYNNMVWLGATYRAQDAVAPMAGVKLLKDKSLRIGVAYDYTLSKLKGNVGSTFEIMLGYCFNIKKQKTPTVYGNVRFLD
ncbi:MAG: type IX secretion system membrane protein PorP/SprF [Bacteroidia bacterium]|nr:type IX secretion system membrane protein PorP/SprF [Bacteroidia bacterium]